MSVATTNPLIVKGQLPAFDRIVPTDILPAVKEDLNTLKSAFDALQTKLTTGDHHQPVFYSIIAQTLT